MTARPAVCSKTSAMPTRPLRSTSCALSSPRTRRRRVSPSAQRRGSSRPAGLSRVVDPPCAKLWSFPAPIPTPRSARYSYLVLLGVQGGIVRIDKDLVAASATSLVLGILADGESYGYAIGKRVHELSQGRLAWTDGMLYPLLHRLERLGYVSASWQVSEQGRRRKHYAITGSGRAAVGEQQRQWTAVDEALDPLWRGGEARTGGI